MTELPLARLQMTVGDTHAFNTLNDYSEFTQAFLKFIDNSSVPAIPAFNSANYICFQLSETYSPRLTRPLNTDLFISDADAFVSAVERLSSFLNDLAKYQERVIERNGVATYLLSREVEKVVYTMQQSIGCVGDSFPNANQARKRIGQLFERLIGLLISALGVDCEPRTVKIPIPGFPGYFMPYELDIVFSRSKVVVTSESQYIYPNEIVGSVKTTSKDRIDKIFLDKFLLTKLLGRNIPVIAVFLHDVQRIERRNEFGINSTFKSNHFLGYTVALNSLDGVYYVDPRPEMAINERLKQQIKSLQELLVHDLWILSAEP